MTTTTDRKFYNNVFTLSVLSEDAPLEKVPLDRLFYLVTEGPCVLHTFKEENVEVTAAAMGDLLLGAASDPGFFQLYSCPACDKARPGEDGFFEPGSVCPNCGHVEPE